MTALPIDAPGKLTLHKAAVMIPSSDRREGRLVNTRRKQWSLGVVLVAAYVLLFQSITGAFALGVGSTPLDAFGNPLCITSTEHSTSAGKGLDHDKMRSCCELACSMVAPALVAASDAPWISADLPHATGAIRHHSSARVPASALDHAPGNPRAPPLTA